MYTFPGFHVILARTTQTLDQGRGTSIPRPSLICSGLTILPHPSVLPRLCRVERSFSASRIGSERPLALHLPAPPPPVPTPLLCAAVPPSSWKEGVSNHRLSSPGSTFPPLTMTMPFPVWLGTCELRAPADGPERGVAEVVPTA